MGRGLKEEGEEMREGEARARMKAAGLVSGADVFIVFYYRNHFGEAVHAPELLAVLSL